MDAEAASAGEESDEALVGRYLAGDEQAFGALVERHLARVYAYARRLGAGEEDAEDVVQDVFLKAWKNLRRYDSGNALLRTWLIAIARNTIIDFLRKRKALPFSYFDTPEGGNALLDALPDEGESAEEMLEGALNAEALERAVASLPLSAREVLHLRYRERLRFEKIAETLGQPLNTVKSRHRRALMALRALLQSAGHDGHQNRA